MLYTCFVSEMDRHPTDIFNTLRSKQNGHHVIDDIFKCILFNEYFCIFTHISLNFSMGQCKKYVTPVR